MAVSPDPLNRAQITVQAHDTGDRFQAPQTNTALQLAGALKEAQPALAGTLQGIADKEALKQQAQAHKDALMTQGQVLADAVRDGKISATQNPWYMEAYAKEGAAIRSQTALSALQTDSTTWAEQSDPAAFARKWRDGVAQIAKDYNSKDEIAGFAPVEAQYTQQTLQSNVSQNQKRIIEERGQNNSALAADALIANAKLNGGVLTPQQGIDAMAPAHNMFIGTGGTEAEWHTMATQAIISAASSTRNPGLIDLTKAIGLDGKPVLDGPVGSGAAMDPPPVAPGKAPQLATAALPPAHAMPVQGGVTVPGGEYGARRSGEVHHGLDLAVPEGTSVVSPGVGTVLDVGSDPHSGNFVKIDHGNGIVSSYAHLSGASVAVGDTVAPGQQIALSGSTGDSTGPHVHWRTKVNGVDVNPQSVAFPQGSAPASNPPQDVAAQVTSDLNAPPADAQAAPPTIARGPSLFDISGQAEGIGQARYRIQQAQEFDVTERLRANRAQVQVTGQRGLDDLYTVHGTSLLLGDYDTVALTKELTAKGYKPQEIGATLAALHEDTSASVGVMNNRIALNGSDPVKAQRVFDLANEGEANGYTVAYDKKVGEAVLHGDISTAEGINFVSRSRSYSRQMAAERRADIRQQRQIEASDPTHVHSYAQLKQQSVFLAGLAASNYFAIVGRPIGDNDRKKVEKQVTDAMGAYLAAHPGEYDGAVAAAREVVAKHGQGVMAQRTHTQGFPTAPAPTPPAVAKPSTAPDEAY